MKKILLFIAGLMLAMSASAQYYLNGTLPGTDWNFGYEFNGTATIACEAGVNYEFKITQGASWDVQFGFSALASVPEGVSETGDFGGNIGFSLPQAGDVTIVFDGSQITLTSSVGFGSFVQPEPTGEYYIAGKGAGDFACGASWDPSACPMANGTVTYTALPAGEYAFKITDGTWNNSWGRAQLADPTAYPENNDNNVVFTLDSASDVTISFDGTTLSLTINGEGGDDNTGDDNTGDIPTTGFSIQVNGSALYAFTDEGAWDIDPSFNQLSLKGIALKAGDTFVFYNNSNGETWASVAVDGASVSGINGTGEVFEVTEGGCYDIYLKLKFGEDNVYFGASDNCPETPTDLEDVDAEDVVVAAYDLIGRPVAIDAPGYVILQYASGKAAKVYNN
jgi:hypothetical protein